MSGLTQTLRLQHRAAEALFEQITHVIERRDRKRTGELLDELDRLVSPHLAEEDQRVYEVLAAYAESRGEQDLATAVREFAGSMSFISQATRAFLARYDGDPPANEEAFRADWSSLQQELRTRMMAEEATIFPLYDRAVAAGAVVR